MPNFMVSMKIDRLRFLGNIPGGGSFIDFLHDTTFNQQNLKGNLDKKMRALEAKATLVIQRAIENVELLSDFPEDDPIVLDPSGQWPMYVEGLEVITRIDTIGIRVLSLDPLKFRVWLGDGRFYQTPPPEWWI